MTIAATTANHDTDASAHSIHRDYWQIDLLQNNFVDPNCQDYFVLIRGRRRTSESFWPGLRLDRDTLLRFGVSIRNAVTVAKGFAADDDGNCHCAFPNAHTLAICNGTDYMLETSETIDGFGRRSISTTVFAMGQPMLPGVHLIDDELRLFCDDLDQVISSIAVESESGISRAVSQGGIV